MAGLSAANGRATRIVEPGRGAGDVWSRKGEGGGGASV